MDWGGIGSASMPNCPSQFSGGGRCAKGTSNTLTTFQQNIDISEFWIGFTTLASNLRFDVVLLLFLLPVSVGLFLKARNGSKNSILLIVLISGTILITPILEMITDYYFVYPYRYVPLVVFFAIGLSTLFSKK